MQEHQQQLEIEELRRQVEILSQKLWKEDDKVSKPEVCESIGYRMTVYIMYGQ